MIRPWHRLTGCFELDPGFSDAQFHRGLVFLDLKKLEEAVNAFHAVTEQDPENTPALFYTGTTLNRARQV